MPEVVIDAPSAGAMDTTGAGGAASPTAPIAPLTDEQILGAAGEYAGSADRDAHIAQPAAEPAGAGENQKTQPNDTARATEQAPGRLTPEVREFFKLHPEIRDSYFRAQEFTRLFPDYKTAELVASQLAEYENPAELAEDLRGVADLRAIDGMFYSGDPAQHGQIVENLFTDNPEAFRLLVESLPTTLLRMANNTAQPELARQAADVLQAVNSRTFAETLEWAHARARAAGNQELEAQLTAVAASLLGSAPWAPESLDRRLAAIQEAQAKLDQARQASAAQAAERFIDDANRQVVGEFTDAAKQTVEQLIGRAYGEEAVRLLTGEIYRRVSTALASDENLVAHVRALARGGAGDPRAQRQIVRLVSNQAKRMIPSVAERVIGAFGQGTLAANEQRQSREAAAARRVDLTGSSGMDARIVKPPTAAQLQRSGKYRQLTDDDILEGRL